MQDVPLARLPQVLREVRGAGLFRAVVRHRLLAVGGVQPQDRTVPLGQGEADALLAQAAVFRDGERGAPAPVAGEHGGRGAPVGPEGPGEGGEARRVPLRGRETREGARGAGQPVLPVEHAGDQPAGVVAGAEPQLDPESGDGGVGGGAGDGQGRRAHTGAGGFQAQLGVEAGGGARRVHHTRGVAHYRVRQHGEAGPVRGQEADQVGELRQAVGLLAQDELRRQGYAKGRRGRVSRGRGHGCSSLREAGRGLRSGRRAR
ncbi:hypothetical protein SANT12839_096670 [Streptomyces antimycoticus]|uniref:Uncharacterized protein n=1 Tax=Streptomyces antimycoticus TaxID=68175 RepID=A0A4D4KIP2_9ACTN|nr:hypothetical protein SANT12839_096670 [Streptomyces antimycoticus]